VQENGTLSDEHPSGGHYYPLPGEAEVPVIAPPPTAEQIRVQAEEDRTQADHNVQRADRQREIRLAIANIRLSRANVYISWVLAACTALGVGAGFYQGHAAGKNATAADAAVQVARDALGKMQKQIDAANTANDISKTVLKGELAPVVTISFTGDPISVSTVVAGIGTQFTNKGKTDATDFRATVTYTKIEIPSFKQLGKKRTKSYRARSVVLLYGKPGWAGKRDICDL
jgi:hypothetical protein